MYVLTKSSEFFRLFSGYMLNPHGPIRKFQKISYISNELKAYFLYPSRCSFQYKSTKCLIYLLCCDCLFFFVGATLYMQQISIRNCLVPKSSSFFTSGFGFSWRKIVFTRVLDGPIWEARSSYMFRGSRDHSILFSPWIKYLIENHMKL